MIIAVDFDGTLCENKYPDIGKPKKFLIGNLIARKKSGDKIILWTCRCGRKLERAVEWCRAKGLEFDAVNENLNEVIQKHGGDTRKIYADLYVDDHAWTLEEYTRLHEELTEWLEEEQNERTD